MSNARPVVAILVIALCAVFVVGLVGGLAGLAVYRASQRPAVEQPRPVGPATRTPPAPPRDSTWVSRRPAEPEVAPEPRPVLPPPPVVVPSEPAPVGVLQPVPVEPAGRFRVGDTFEQEVTVTRRSAFRTLGVEASQGAQYSLGSTIAVTKLSPDGTVAARQTITSVKLIDADRDLRQSLAAALEKAKGSAFDLTIGPKGEVTALTGVKDPIQVLAGKDAALGQTLRLWSILDADAWKELAGLTFFQPESTATWDRRLEHDWGPLGSWRGKTVYKAGKPGTYDYRHELYYRPAAAGAGQGLPFRVVKVDFQPPASRGAIQYDAARKRVAFAEEAFRVYGTVLVSAGGADVAIEMIEEQGFRLAVRQPMTNDLVGGRK